MGLFLVVAGLGDPYLVGKRSLLALRVFVGAAAVEAWVELAWDLEMREFAAVHRAIRSVATQRHGWVSEGAVRVCAVREEPADFFRLVSCFDGGGRVASGAFPVLARCPESTDIVHVDRAALRCCR